MSQNTAIFNQITTHRTFPQISRNVKLKLTTAMLMPIAPILKDPLIASVLRDTPEMVSRVWVSGDHLLL